MFREVVYNHSKTMIEHNCSKRTKFVTTNFYMFEANQPPDASVRGLKLRNRTKVRQLMRLSCQKHELSDQVAVFRTFVWVLMMVGFRV